MLAALLDGMRSTTKSIHPNLQLLSAGCWLTAHCCPEGLAESAQLARPVRAGYVGLSRARLCLSSPRPLLHRCLALLGAAHLRMASSMKHALQSSALHTGCAAPCTAASPVMASSNMPMHTVRALALRSAELVQLAASVSCTLLKLNRCSSKPGQLPHKSCLAQLVLVRPRLEDVLHLALQRLAVPHNVCSAGQQYQGVFERERQWVFSLSLLSRQQGGLPAVA